METNRSVGCGWEGLLYAGVLVGVEASRETIVRGTCRRKARWHVCLHAYEQASMEQEHAWAAIKLGMSMCDVGEAVGVTGL